MDAARCVGVPRMERLQEWLDIKQLSTQVVSFLPQLVAAIIVFALFVILYRITRPLLRGILTRASFQEALIRLIVENFYRYAILIVGLVMAADQIGINVGAALAGLGIAGIAVGFAAQDSVANVISGILIFWDKPFVVGDWIRAEGEYGCVSNITLRTTRIRTTRNTYVVIPNKSIIDAVLENFSKHGELRVDVPLGIAYKEDIRKARDVLMRAINDMEGIRSNPEPDVIVSGLGDSSVNLEVRVWIDHAYRQPATSAEVVERAKIALDEAGIEIPFPHLQLFVDNVQDRVWEKALTTFSMSRR